MSTLQDQDRQHTNTIYKPKYPKEEASAAFYDGHTQQEDADEDRMELDPAEMQVNSVYYNQIDSNGLEVGKRFYTAEDTYGDNSYLDSLLPHWNSESGVNFNSPSASHLFGYHLSDIRNQPSDQEDYGYQVQAQGLPEGDGNSYTADSNPSSSFAYNGEALKHGPASHSSMPLRVDNSAFNNHMRQYQQAAIASQNNDSSTAPYFQQSSHSEVSAPAQSAQAQITQVSTKATTTPSLRHSSASSKESSADARHEDRRWLNWVEQASQKQEFDAAANENPTNDYFSRHLVNFSRTLWEASDVSHENGTIAERTPGKSPAQHDHTLAAGSQQHPYPSSLSAPAEYPHNQGAFQLPHLIPERSTIRRHLADADNFEGNDGSAIRAEDSNVHQVWNPSSQQHALQQAEAYDGVSPHPPSNKQIATGTSAKHAAPDWSQASRQRLRTIAPIQIPRPSSRSSRASDGPQTSLCTPGSSNGPFNSPVDAAASSAPPPPSLKRKESPASSIQEAAAQSTSGRGSYECNICGRKFSRPSALVVHERVHSGEQPYLCEICNRAFTVASNLRRHQKTHTQQLDVMAAYTETDETIRAPTVKPRARRQNRDLAGMEGDSQDSDLSREDE